MKCPHCNITRFKTERDLGNHIRAKHYKKSSDYLNRPIYTNCLACGFGTRIIQQTGMCAVCTFGTAEAISEGDF